MKTLKIFGYALLISVLAATMFELANLAFGAAKVWFICTAIVGIAGIVLPITQVINKR